MRHVLHIMGREGDTEIAWEDEGGVAVADAPDFQKAKNAFDAVMGDSSSLAFVPTGPDTGNVVKELDPQAVETIVTPRVVGG